jgi:hypothetical protein
MTEHTRLTIELAPEAQSHVQARASEQNLPLTLTELLHQAVALHRLGSQHGILPNHVDLVPAHPQCQRRGHDGLYVVDYTQHHITGAHTRNIADQCRTCGQNQFRIQAIYPPGYPIYPPTYSIPVGQPGGQKEP